LVNLVEQALGGFIGGFFGGIIGYVTDLMIGTMFQAFEPFFPLYALYGIIYAIFSFLLGIAAAYVAGVFFCLGIITAGFLLNDFVTIVSGLISLSGIILSFLLKQRRSNADYY
jgi:hypothetical protein